MDGRAARKARSHEAIVSAAARLIRESGAGGLSVDALMESAGLTRGGFYAHFEDKEELVAEALDRAFAEQRRMLVRDGIEGRALLESMVERYLSKDHLAHPEMGCPVPPLAAEVARSTDRVRAVFRNNLLRLVRLMRDRMGGSEEEMFGICAMAVGAMTIARAVGEQTTADRVLAAARSSLLGSGRTKTKKPARRRRRP